MPDLRIIFLYNLNACMRRTSDMNALRLSMLQFTYFFYFSNFYSIPTYFFIFKIFIQMAAYFNIIQVQYVLLRNTNEAM